MIISHSKKFVFIHVPKTGGTSLLGRLVPYLPRYKGQKIESTHGWQIRWHVGPMHQTLQEGRIENLVDRYTVFGAVRNPWDYVVSRYTFQGKGRTLRQYLIQDRNKKNYHRPIGWPQTTWFKLNDEMRADMILRFESLDDDFKRLCEKIDIPYSPLPRFNWRPPRNWRKYYDTETVEMVRDMFREDIKEFGYEYS